MATTMGWGDFGLGAVGILGQMANANQAAGETVRQAEYQTQSLGQRLAMESRNLEQQARIAAANNAAMVDAARKNAESMIASLQRQEGLVGDEQQRQQQYARGQRDVVDANTGLFGDFAGQTDAQSGSIASAIMDLINSTQAPTDGTPAATGMAADREAAMRAAARSDVAGDVGRQSKIQAFDEVMKNIGFAQGSNNQLGSLLGNFAQGSASVLDPALKAAGMWFEETPIQQGYVPQERYINMPYQSGGASKTGDLLQMFSQVGAKAGLGDKLNAMFADPAATGAGLKMPRAPNMDYMGGGLGLTPQLGGGTGLKVQGNSGLVLNSNLGIK